MYKITLYPAKGGRDQGWSSRVGAGLEQGLSEVGADVGVDVEAGLEHGWSRIGAGLE